MSDAFAETLRRMRDAGQSSENICVDLTSSYIPVRLDSSRSSAVLRVANLGLWRYLREQPDGSKVETGVVDGRQWIRTQGEIDWSTYDESANSWRTLDQVMEEMLDPWLVLSSIRIKSIERLAPDKGYARISALCRSRNGFSMAALCAPTADELELVVRSDGRLSAVENKKNARVFVTHRAGYSACDDSNRLNFMP